MSLKNKLFKEMFKMSPAAAHQAKSMSNFQYVVDPTRPNPTHGSTRPMDNSESDFYDFLVS